MSRSAARGAPSRNDTRRTLRAAGRGTFQERHVSRVGCRRGSSAQHACRASSPRVGFLRSAAKLHDRRVKKPHVSHAAGGRSSLQERHVSQVARVAARGTFQERHVSHAAGCAARAGAASGSSGTCRAPVGRGRGDARVARAARERGGASSRCAARRTPPAQEALRVAPPRCAAHRAGGRPRGARRGDLRSGRRQQRRRNPSCARLTKGCPRRPAFPPFRREAVGRN